MSRSAAILVTIPDDLDFAALEREPGDASPAVHARAVSRRLPRQWHGCRGNPCWCIAHVARGGDRDDDVESVLAEIARRPK